MFCNRRYLAILLILLTLSPLVGVTKIAYAQTGYLVELYVYEPGMVRFRGWVNFTVGADTVEGQRISTFTIELVNGTTINLSTSDNVSILFSDRIIAGEDKGISWIKTFSTITGTRTQDMYIYNVSVTYIIVNGKIVAEDTTIGRAVVAYSDITSTLTVIVPPIPPSKRNLTIEFQQVNTTNASIIVLFNLTPTEKGYVYIPEQYSLYLGGIVSASQVSYVYVRGLVSNYIVINIPLPPVPPIPPRPRP